MDERDIATVRGFVQWLHSRADSMNDPHAKAILNSAAHDLGNNKEEVVALAARKPSVEAVKAEFIYRANRWMDATNDKDGEAKANEAAQAIDKLYRGEG